jgi:hypothetical protein
MSRSNPTQPKTPNSAQLAASLGLLGQATNMYDSILDKFAFYIATHLHRLEKETAQNELFSKTS